MTTIARWMRLVVLPIGFLFIGVFALLFQMWAAAAIAALLLGYFLVVVRSQYQSPGDRDGKSWLQDARDVVTVPSRWGPGLLVAAVGLLIVVFAFGFGIGVAVGIAVWLTLFGLWIAAVRKRSRAGRD